MKRFFLFLIILMFSIGCNNEDASEPKSTPTSQVIPEPEVEESREGDEPESPPTSGLSTITFNVSLPDGAVFSEDDLLVSSLFTESSIVVEGKSNVEIFEGDGYELSFAEDGQGNILLLNYLDPSSNTAFELNASTTAQSMVLMQYWISELSPTVKKEIIELVSSMPEFIVFRDQIENSLLKSESPLNDPEVLSELILVLDKAFELNSESGKILWTNQKEPLKLTGLENGQIKIENTSSFAYGIRVNDNINPERLEGVDRSLLSIVNGEIRELIFNDTFSVPIELNGVTDGINSIEASNGFGNSPFEYGEITNYNYGKISVVLVNLLTSGLLSNAQPSCIQAIGSSVLSKGAETNNNIRNALNSNETLASILNILMSYASIGENIYQSCTLSVALNQKSLFKALKAVSAISTISNVVEAGYLAKDRFFLPTKLNFCVDKQNGVFQQCKELSVTGEPSFGKVPVGLAGNASITIENRSNDLVVLGSISFPYPELYSVLPGIQNFQLEAGQKQTFLLSYDAKTINGTSLYQMSGNIVISTSLTNDGTITLPVNGEVVNPLLLMDATQNLEVSNLNFPNSPIGTISETKSVRVVNVSDYDIIFPPAQNTEPLDGYQYSWGEQTISSSGGDFKLDFKLSPQTATDYNEELLINTGSSQVLNLKLNGTGIESLLSWEFEDGSNDFGEVEVNSSRSKNLIVTNNSNTVVDIRDVNSSDMEIFSIASQDRGFTLEPNKSRSINVSFNPKNTLVYDNRTIEIITDNAVDNLQVTVKGEGVETTNYSLIPVSSTRLLGTQNTVISEQLQVQVVDQNNNPVPNISVVWDFLYGNRDSPSIVSSVTTSSNSEGIAQTPWTLGSWSCAGDGSTYFNVDYAIASLENGYNQEAKVSFCSQKHNAILQVGANNSSGGNGTPVSGSITMSFGGYSHTWSIQDNLIVGDDPNFGVTPADIILPNEDNFELNGTITINLNRTANVNLTICKSWEECGEVGFEYGSGSSTLMYDGEGNYIDENGNYFPASKSVPIRVNRTFN